MALPPLIAARYPAFAPRSPSPRTAVRDDLAGDDLRWLAEHATEAHVPAGATIAAADSGAARVVLAGTFVGRDFATGGRRVMAGDVLGSLARRPAATGPLTAETDAVVLTLSAADVEHRRVCDPGFPARLRAAAVYLSPGRVAAARGDGWVDCPVAEMPMHQLVEALLSDALAR